MSKERLEPGEDGWRGRCPECLSQTVTFTWLPSCSNDGNYVSGCCGPIYDCSACGWCWSRLQAIPRRQIAARIRIERAARRRARKKARKHREALVMFR